MNWDQIQVIGCNSRQGPYELGQAHDEDVTRIGGRRASSRPAAGALWLLPRRSRAEIEAWMKAQRTRREGSAEPLH